jgi:hypothetical protein
MQSQYQVGVLVPPTYKRFVKPVHCLIVPAPHSEVATAYASPRKLGLFAYPQVWQADTGSPFVGTLFTPTGKPIAKSSAIDFLLALHDRLGQIGIEQDAAAIDKASLLSQLAMPAYKVGLWDTVTIQKHDVAAMG